MNGLNRVTSALHPLVCQSARAAQHKSPVRGRGHYDRRELTGQSIATVGTPYVPPGATLVLIKSRKSVAIRLKCRA